MKTKIFQKNEFGRDFVVGDLHGHKNIFEYALKVIFFDKSVDRMFSVGDLVDRGPDSAGCLRLTREPWFHAVRGNHEDMLIRTFCGRPTQWERNGGRWWHSVPNDERRELYELAANLPHAIVVHGSGGRFNVLHGEFFGSDSDIDSGDFSKEQIETILWGRDTISGFGVTTPELSMTVVGHTPIYRPIRVGSHLFIDGGAFVPGRALFVFEPATGFAWSVYSGVDPANLTP